MKILRVTLAAVSTFVLLACGGGSKGPKSPESTAGITETAAHEDMPPAPSKDGETPAPADKAAPAPAGPSGGILKVAAMSFTPAKPGKDDPKAIELKADGSVLLDGKPAAKVKGDEVTSTQGTSMVTVGIDGSLVGNGVKPGLKLDGDELTTGSGVKVSVGDDGTITAAKDGKAEVLGKADGGASARRAALVVAALWLNIPAEVGAEPAKPEKGKKSGKKPAGKPKK